MQSKKGKVVIGLIFETLRSLNKNIGRKMKAVYLLEVIITFKGTF